jgi:hypothetical protein
MGANYVPGGVSTGDDVPLSALQVGPQIGSGGQGRVYELRNSEKLAYKQYHDPRRIRPEAISHLVSIRKFSHPADRSWLDSHLAWPMCRVTSDGLVVGFIMRRVSRAFRWRDATGGLRLTELQFLVREPKRPWQQIIQPRPGQRRQLAHELAEATRRLHSWDIIIGDISDVNILWAVKPDPAVYFIDCDGLRLRGKESIVDQADTPDWHDPAQRSRIPGMDADRYKTALAIARILCRKPLVTPGDQLDFVPGTLGYREAEVRRLLAAAASGPGKRPDAVLWTKALSDG